MVQLTTTEETPQDSELRILEAAKRVFVKKGMDGAVMQDIADAAEISRTALHYYFRSKEKLFDAVLEDLLNRIFPQLEKIILQDMPFNSKVKLFVEEYFDLLRANPYLPNFIMNELTKNPERMIARLSQFGFFTIKTRERFTKELHQLNKDIPAEQFVMNLISLCVFPFIAKPLVKAFYINGKPDAFDRFIDVRKKVIINTLMRSLK
jgi:TetR/AcrR family transcriptional regulator